ncbi:MAG: flagellar biosynthesis protein FlgB [Geminicoccaceae bacterium]|nr:MAG: flagellar biosynthesis protein FlgB [Geminicoccaceae bacterium]
MLQGFRLFDLASQRLDYLEQRHGVITRNIANADTPGFKAKDVREPNFKRMLEGGTAGGPLALATTRNGHVQPKLSPGAGRLMRPTLEVSPSGNAVSLEEEAGKLRATAGQHGKVTAVYGKYTGFLKMVAGGQG